MDVTCNKVNVHNHSINVIFSIVMGRNGIMQEMSSRYQTTSALFIRKTSEYKTTRYTKGTWKMFQYIV